MSAPEGNLFDDYPDDTRDEAEEMDHSFGMQEVGLGDVARESISYGIPTCDMDPEEVEALLIEYPAEKRKTLAERAWDFNVDRDTFIISGPTTEFARERGVRGRMFEDKKKAKEWAMATYGQILETVIIPHKWAFRVLKPTAHGGRYTPPGGAQ